MTRQFPSKTYGAVSENICVAYFSYLGYQVSKPICDDSRYDFLIDDGNSIKKVQCKTSITKDNKTYPTIDLVPKRRKGGYKIGDFDLLWILTSIGIFLMESEDVPNDEDRFKSFTLSPKYDAFLIDFPLLYPEKTGYRKPQGTRQITPEEGARISALASRGATVKVIGMIMGLRQEHVRHYLTSYKKITTRKFIPKEMRPEIVKMHNNGVPTSVIADIIGISAHAVGEALRASGIYKRSRYNKHALDEKTRESIYHLKQSGTPISEIPDILNLGPYTKLDTSEAH